VTKMNETVMNSALTLGRTDMGMSHDIRKPVPINGKTYYQSTPEVSFTKGVPKLPVMVWFSDEGTATTVIMNACGNGVEGEKVKSSATCKALNKIEVAGKK